MRPSWLKLVSLFTLVLAFGCSDNKERTRRPSAEGGAGGDGGASASTGGTGGTQPNGGAGGTQPNGGAGGTQPNGGAPGVPDHVAVGSVDCGATATASVTVTNPTSETLTLGASSSLAALTISPATLVIAPGDSGTVTLELAVPGDATPGIEVNGTVTVTGLPDGDQQIPVTYTPNGAVLSLEPAGTLELGNVPQNRTGTGVYTLTNQGTDTVELALGEFDDSAFAASLDATTLAPAGSAEATVTFTPGTLGAQEAQATLTVTGVVCGEVPALVAAATVVEPEVVSVTGSPAVFATVACGAEPAAQTVTLTNDTSEVLTFSAAVPADPQGDEALYTVTPTSGTLEPGAVQDLTITAAATTVLGNHDAVLAIETEGTALVTAETFEVPLQLSATGAVLELGATALDFGYLPSAASLTRTVSVTNTGTTAATVTLGGLEVPFSVEAPTTSIAPAASVDIPVTYTALQAGVAVADTLTLTGDGLCDPVASVALTAGVGPFASPGEPAAVSGTCIADLSSEATPTFAVPTGTGTLSVANEGNADLVLLSCAELGDTGVISELTYVAPSGAGGAGGASGTGGATGASGAGGAGGAGGGPEAFPLTIPAGESAELTFSWLAPEPLRAGETTATVRCVTNQPEAPLDLTVTRTVHGADLVLAPDLVEFSCADYGGSADVGVTNEGDLGVHVALEGYISATGTWVQSSMWSSSANLAPGASGPLTVHFGSSGTCSALTGELYLAVVEGSGYASSAAICSMTPNAVTATVTNP